MARTVEYIYRIHVGPSYHVWTCGDPAVPLGRYTVLRTVVVNGHVMEAPDEHQLARCLQKVYTSTVAYAEAACLNEAWWRTDPNNPEYDPNFSFEFPEP